VKHNLNHLIVLLAVALLAGCSGGNSSILNPNQPDLVDPSAHSASQNQQTHLWGYWDVYIDVENQTVEVYQNRSVEFTANVVTFVNKPPTNLGFKINEITIVAEHTDVDIDVSISHPFPGMHAYDGYDVRGVLIGEASETLSYNTDLEYPVKGTDQCMLDDPANGDGGGPDGYTRWYNPTEFKTEGLLGYTPGVFASPGYKGDATLCPYKYFTNNLGANENLWDFLLLTANDGVFSAGETNTRNYFIRFPNTIGVKYGYAIIANWESETTHPSNTPEAICCKVVNNSNLYYVNGTTKGGKIILDISLFDWENLPSKIFIESTVLAAVAEFSNPPAIQTGSGNHYTEYHVEIPANNIKGLNDQEFWVIAQYDGFNYTNNMGVTNLAGNDPLAAAFRFDLVIQTAAIEVLTPNGGEVLTYGYPADITWTPIPATGTVDIEYSKDNFNSDINPIVSGEPNDGSYTWAPVPCDVSDTVRVRIKRTDNANVYDISDDDFSIVDTGWAKTWGGLIVDNCRGVAIDDTGNIYTTGYYAGTVDFDPEGGDPHTTGAIFLSKLDRTGNFLWAKTWGISSYNDHGYGVAVDNSGNIYITGEFAGTVNFNPAGSDPHTSKGARDIFLTKFDSSGNHLWAKTWGGTSYDTGYGVAIDGSGNVYVTGVFTGSVDFNPSGGNNFTSNGGNDIFLSKFNSSGTFTWAKTWGGNMDDYGRGVTIDNSGNAYLTGEFQNLVDFDPSGNVVWESSYGGSDVFLSKFSQSGSFNWVKTWGYVFDEFGRGPATDQNNNIYVAGFFQSTVDFDPDGGDPHSSNGSYDTYLTKFDANGNFAWAQTWGGASGDYGYDVAADGFDHVYVCGEFFGASDFDPQGGDPRSSNGGFDTFLSRFDTSGNYVWARTWGGVFTDRSFSVGVDSYENSFTVGEYQDAVNFAPTSPPCNEASDVHTSLGNYDAFLSKHLPDGCW